jgi:hypothetical protein
MNQRGLVRIVFALAVTFAWLPWGIGFAREPSADRIFFGGPIITMNPRQPEASALAIRAGRILGVGPKDRILRFQGPATQMIDLRGHTLMPGFIEPHARTC